MIKQVLIKPVISEKTINLAENNNQYTFIVNINSNKYTVKEAVEEKFDVEVKSVKIINVLGKKVSFGRRRITGRKSNRKKAIVKLKEGDTIPLFNMKS